MSDIAITVSNLSKKYQLGARKERYSTLRDELASGFRSVLRGSWRGSRDTEPNDTLWALKNISFEVPRGEALAIIGRNGAGKSTLLKILSRITEPSTGRCEIRGRLGSLLEVGTGFHGELTGGENVYLNGAILGMNKAEIERKFDEIVAFADVEQFIDTPIKRYSSGMQMRLAFAVAAHLEPDILIVDEVLAVGDLAFQQKCLGKLEDVARQGRTVLFVSHNLGAVMNLCTTGLWLNEGSIQMRGDANSVVDAYVKSQRERPHAGAASLARKGSGEARIVRVRLLDSSGDERDSFIMGESIRVEFDVEFYRNFPQVNCTLEVTRTEMSMCVLHIRNDDSGFGIHHLTPGTRRFAIDIPNCMLYPTGYEVMLCIWSQTQVIDYVEAVATFSMIQSDVTRRTEPLTHHPQAIYYTPTVWSELSLD